MVGISHISRPACLVLILSSRAISDRVRQSLTSQKYPVLGYLQSLPYHLRVAKRDAHDERYLKAIEALRAARKQARLTQTELALKLGRRQQFVSKYESGERRLDIIEFLDVAKALDLIVESLLRDLGAQN